MAVTWDAVLIERFGEAGRELHGKKAEDPSVGLKAWAPVNPLRTPVGTEQRKATTRYFDDGPAACAAALHTGVDSFTDDGDNPAPSIAYLNEALKQGHIVKVAGCS